MKPILEKYAANDSISSKEILKDLYFLYETGNYNNVKARITDDGSSNVNFSTEAKPIVNGILFEGVTLIERDKIYLFYRVS
jgi:outer membrane protein assembly factor BamA